jgi:hypothetical protein
MAVVHFRFDNGLRLFLFSPLTSLPEYFLTVIALLVSVNQVDRCCCSTFTASAKGVNLLQKAFAPPGGSVSRILNIIPKRVSDPSCTILHVSRLDPRICPYLSCFYVFNL